MAEYKSKQQVNIPWGESFNMGVKSPAIAKRIFLTFDDAQAFVDDVDQSATPGIRITVLSNYVKDEVATYTEGHFVYLNDVWVTAEGQSSGDTYTLGSDIKGVYYVDSIGDGTNPGELVRVGGGSSGIYTAGDAIIISEDNVISVGDIDCGEY
jgi:hypothetical protein